MTIRIPNYKGKLFELSMYEEARESAPYGDITYMLTKKVAAPGIEERPMLIINCPDGSIFPDHFDTFSADNPDLQLSNKMVGHDGADFLDKRHTILFYITKTEQ